MSRIGNRSLVIPQGVELTLQSLNYLTVSGPKGNLSKQLPTAITINVNPETKTVTTVRPDDSKKHKQLHGTTNAITKWMMIGVTEGFSKKLEINGVGYRANVQGNTLNLSLGYSHPIKYEIPEGIKIEAPKPTILVISGIDKQLVGKVTAEIRQFRPPEPYKGKGIKYEDEIIRRKEGKAAGKGK